MAMKRTSVYVDPEDLALIKEAARRRGVPQAQIIREAVHLAAMANRVRDEPLDWPMFTGCGETATGEEVTKAVTNAHRGATSTPS